MVLSFVEEILLTIGYAIIFIATIAGNLFVCAIVLKTKHLQNFTSILLVNMAVGDLIVGAAGVMHIILETLVLIYGTNKYTLLCGVLNGIVLFSASISIYTMAVLAFDRYLSIVKPVIRRLKLTKSKLKSILPVIWVFSFAILGPCMYFIQKYDFKEGQLICWETLPQDEFPISYRITLFALMYFIPMCITLFFFGKIFIYLWVRKHDRKSPTTSQVLLKSRQHVTRILGSVILFFNICWLPWFIIELSSSFGWLIRSEALQSGLALLAVSHSSMNPFIYMFQSSNFRRHIRRITKNKRQVIERKKHCAAESVNNKDRQVMRAEGKQLSIP